MLRLMFILLLLSLLVTACKKNTRETCPSETYEYHFKNNARVDTTRVGSPPQLIANTANGNKRVFTYMYAYSVCPDLIDGGSFQFMLFETDPAAIHFKLYADDLQNALCYYRNGNVLFSPDAFIPEGGVIEGTRINDQKWQVNIDLKLRNNQTLTTSAVFTVQ